MSPQTEAALSAVKVIGGEYLAAQAKMIAAREAAAAANDEARRANGAFDTISTAYRKVQDDLARALQAEGSLA